MKVSVIILTYNHEKYIAETIESALSQRTDFDFELVIGEDASTDRTRETVLEYKNRYPDRIKLFLPEKNVGPLDNYSTTSSLSSGQYIAYLEGDDFWINPYKLQIQASYLDEHPQCSGCFSDSLVVDENGAIKQSTYYIHGQRNQNIYTADDIVRITGITPANTLVYRRKITDDMPGWYSKFPGHSALELLITLNGTLDYLNFHFGARRIHTKSVWATKPNLYRIRWGILAHKFKLSDMKLNALYGDIIFEHLIDALNAAYTEINNCRVQYSPDIMRSANIDFDGIADNWYSAFRDHRLEDLSCRLAEDAEKLLDNMDTYSASWLYRIALDMNPSNILARTGWIFSRKQLIAAL